MVKYFTGAKLGLTATPDREDEADIRGTFGPEVVKITLEEAIARGWLPRIEYHVITDESLDEGTLAEICQEIRERHRRFSIQEINKRLFIRKRDAEIAKIVNGYDEKAVVFCASVQHADRFVKHLKLGDTFHSRKGNSAKDSWKKNQTVLDHLKNGIVRRVCAVNAFNEGVNVPSVGLVAFCRVTGSMTIFRQQLGRGLRPGKAKLIVLDFVGNLERVKAVMELMNQVADFHERITSNEEREREGYSRSKFEVTGAGFEFTFSDEIVDVIKVLEATQVDFYPTWQEASKAAIGLGIKSQGEYYRRYKEDSRLPSNPLDHYENFPNMVNFLGGSKASYYKTWQEASKAAVKLGIENSTDYKHRYREDPCLVSVPDRKYKNFPGWPIFLGKQTKNYYPEWQEASQAAIKLGIKTKLEYDSRYTSNKRLPAAPNQYYANFPGWVVFLGGKPKKLYPTWEEASRAAIRLGARSSFEYRKARKKDKSLPTAPWTKYKNFPGWSKFLGKE